MWQRFTERARRCVFFAQEEAGRLGENLVSTEHLLLGMVRESDSAAVKILQSMNVNAEMIRKEVESQIERGEGKLGADMQLTWRAKRVIDLSYDEARRLNNDYIGSEHLLLGLVREGEGLAARILKKMGVTLDNVRQAVSQLQRGEEIVIEQAEAAASGEEQTTVGFDVGQPITVTQRSLAGLRSFGGSFVSALRQTEDAKAMVGKDLSEIALLSKGEIDAIFNSTRVLKTELPPDVQRRLLQHKTLAMIFEKPSLRTRVTFETGMFQLGGQAIYLQPSDIQLGLRETIADAARNLSRWVNLIMARTFSHQTITELAEYADIPVINGLSDLEHPCQALADFYTILEKKQKLEGLKLAFIGDGNNVAHSLMLLASKVGTSFAIACPKGYEPNKEVVKKAKAFAKKTGAAIEVVSDPVKAVEGADAVYTDVWASMGQESEADERAKVFASYQVNAELMKHAKPDAIFEHCLPAHRGQEVTDEVLDGPQSVVLDEAENRLHVQKGIMALLVG